MSQSSSIVEEQETTTIPPLLVVVPSTAVSSLSASTTTTEENTVSSTTNLPNINSRIYTEIMDWVNNDEIPQKVFEGILTIRSPPSSSSSVPPPSSSFVGSSSSSSSSSIATTMTATTTANKTISSDSSSSVVSGGGNSVSTSSSNGDGTTTGNKGNKNNYHHRNNSLDLCKFFYCWMRKIRKPVIFLSPIRTPNRRKHQSRRNHHSTSYTTTPPTTNDHQSSVGSDNSSNASSVYIDATKYANISYSNPSTNDSKMSIIRIVPESTCSIQYYQNELYITDKDSQFVLILGYPSTNDYIIKNNTPLISWQRIGKRILLEWIRFWEILADKEKLLRKNHARSKVTGALATSSSTGKSKGFTENSTINYNNTNNDNNDKEEEENEKDDYENEKDDDTLHTFENRKINDVVSFRTVDSGGKFSSRKQRTTPSNSVTTAAVEPNISSSVGVDEKNTDDVKLSEITHTFKSDTDSDAPLKVSNPSFNRPILCMDDNNGRFVGTTIIFSPSMLDAFALDVTNSPDTLSPVPSSDIIQTEDSGMSYTVQQFINLQLSLSSQDTTNSSQDTTNSAVIPPPSSNRPKGTENNGNNNNSAYNIVQKLAVRNNTGNGNNNKSNNGGTCYGTDTNVGTTNNASLFSLSSNVSSVTMSSLSGYYSSSQPSSTYHPSSAGDPGKHRTPHNTAMIHNKGRHNTTSNNTYNVKPPLSSYPVEATNEPYPYAPTVEKNNPGRVALPQDIPHSVSKSSVNNGSSGTYTASSSSSVNGYNTVYATPHSSVPNTTVYDDNSVPPLSSDPRNNHIYYVTPGPTSLPPRGIIPNTLSSTQTTSTYIPVPSTAGDQQGTVSYVYPSYPPQSFSHPRGGNPMSNGATTDQYDNNPPGGTVMTTVGTNHPSVVFPSSSYVMENSNGAPTIMYANGNPHSSVTSNGYTIISPGPSSSSSGPGYEYYLVPTQSTMVNPTTMNVYHNHPSAIANTNTLSSTHPNLSYYPAYAAAPSFGQASMVYRYGIGPSIVYNTNAIHPNALYMDNGLSSSYTSNPVTPTTNTAINYTNGNSTNNNSNSNSISMGYPSVVGTNNHAHFHPSGLSSSSSPTYY